jgi:hypothetical protein
MLLEYVARNLRVGAAIVRRVVRQPMGDGYAESCRDDQDSEED